MAQIYPIKTIIAPTYTMTNIKAVKVDMYVRTTREVRVEIEIKSNIIVKYKEFLKINKVKVSLTNNISTIVNL